MEVDQPFQVIKDAIINYPDVIEAEINCLQCFQTVEPVSGEILQQVVAEIQESDGRDLVERSLVDSFN